MVSDKLTFFVTTEDFDTIATGGVMTAAPREVYTANMETLNSCVLNPLKGEMHKQIGDIAKKLIVIDMQGFNEAMQSKDS